MGEQRVSIFNRTDGVLVAPLSVWRRAALHAHFARSCLFRAQCKPQVLI
jgi:hypothetical protein